ncbi:pilus assembly protein CpaE [bacterium]|nr:pilus assembly protein CpaE [bacterium]
MISVDTARCLKESGLEWTPENGDKFFIPDRDLNDEVFSLSEMTVGIRHVPGGAQISFNGAVEWALDAIMKSEVVWLPSEEQLRTLIADRFVGLTAIDYGYRCEVALADGVRGFEAIDAGDAYGTALLGLRKSAPGLS